MDDLPDAIYEWLRQACPFLGWRLNGNLRHQLITAEAPPGNDFPLAGNPQYIHYLFVDLEDASLRLETCFQLMTKVYVRRWFLCDSRWPDELLAHLRDFAHDPREQLVAMDAALSIIRAAERRVACYAHTG